MADRLGDRTVAGARIEMVSIRRVFGGWYAIVRTVDGRSRAMVEGPVTSEERAWGWVRAQLDPGPTS